MNHSRKLYMNSPYATKGRSRKLRDKRPKIKEPISTVIKESKERPSTRRNPNENVSQITNQNTSINVNIDLQSDNCMLIESPKSVHTSNSEDATSKQQSSISYEDTKVDTNLTKPPFDNKYAIELIKSSTDLELSKCFEFGEETLIAPEDDSIPESVDIIKVKITDFEEFTVLHDAIAKFVQDSDVSITQVKSSMSTLECLTKDINCNPVLVMDLEKPHNRNEANFVIAHYCTSFEPQLIQKKEFSTQANVSKHLLNDTQTHSLKLVENHKQEINEVDVKCQTSNLDNYAKLSEVLIPNDNISLTRSMNLLKSIANRGCAHILRNDCIPSQKDTVEDISNQVPSITVHKPSKKEINKMAELKRLDKFDNCNQNIYQNKNNNVSLFYPTIATQVSSMDLLANDVPCSQYHFEQHYLVKSQQPPKDMQYCKRQFNGCYDKDEVRNFTDCTVSARNLMKIDTCGLSSSDSVASSNFYGRKRLYNGVEVVRSRGQSRGMSRPYQDYQEYQDSHTKMSAHIERRIMSLGNVIEENSKDDITVKVNESRSRGGNFVDILRKNSFSALPMEGGFVKPKRRFERQTAYHYK